ncbi:TadE/TadG family type IV pilus assembly protein [Methylobacterium iners]|uniref:Putative Flp pilus-assembly TadG-like N-terminal domain-containing protein n=1 Tax=Methylobacterium iners TaxID=418707 RepID=A0ABQ4S099_9HYPH|nr:TadE/TadG family type IV pilus assembly protein [Methylobacterium iners]GJD95848.1 hypothetical protein OCOJLMKI_3064 [Methylobacterium iners]
MNHYVRALTGNNHGGVALIFALAIPVLMGLTSAALEYGSLVKRRTELQRAADGGSIAGVNQFKLANTDDAAAIRAAIAMAQGQAQASTDRQPQVQAEVLGNHSSVKVTVRESVPLAFGKLLNVPQVELVVHSTAKLAGTTRLCLLALDPTRQGAFHLEASARITATDCSLYSNSTSSAGIQAENNAVASSISTCTAGGYKGSSANFTPPPATGCPPLKDPLAGRARPSPGPCIVLPTYTNPKKGDDGPDDPAYGSNVVSGTVTLDPGTYCGGLRLTKKASVTLRPGTYIMKDGPLIVDKKGSLAGTNVSLYFTGDKAGLLFDQDSVVSLTAPRDGDMAGLLFSEDPETSSPISLPLPASGKGKAKNAPEGALGLREYRIISDEARTLLGTIYLPVGRLIIDSKKPVADQSAYTVIVARQINLYDGPNLMLNARYGSTDVPVPEGVGPSSADTVLSH